MKIVMREQISGTRDGRAWPAPGTEVDLPEGEAKGLVAGGAAYDLDNEDGIAAVRGTVLTKEDLAGAPVAREITLGQPDTNLSRARVVAEQGEDVAKRAAEEIGYDNGPGDNDEPKVGDGSTEASATETSSVDPSAETATGPTARRAAAKRV